MPILYNAHLSLEFFIQNAEAGSDKHQDIYQEITRKVKGLLEQTIDPKLEVRFYPSSLSISGIRNTEKTNDQMLSEKTDEDYQQSLDSTTDRKGTKPDSEIPHRAEVIPHRTEEETASPKETAEALNKYTK